MCIRDRFHVVPWPAIRALSELPPEEMKRAHDGFTAAHHLLVKVTYGLIVLHVAAALRHQVVKRDDILARMVPFLRVRGAP